MIVNYKRIVYFVFIFLVFMFFLAFAASNQFAYNYLDNKIGAASVNMSLLEIIFVKYQNSTKDVNLTGKQLYIKNINFNSGDFNCDLTINGTICSNNSGTYIVG